MKKLSYFFFSAVVFFNIVLGYAFSAESVLFLDVNDNPLEIAVAKKAAAAKNQKLIVYPLKGLEITNDGLQEVLMNNKFSSMTISGHSGGMSFHGKNGAVDLKSLSDILAKSPSKDVMESLYLLGCNAGNKSKILFWKESLKNLKFIAGFDGIAPLGHNQAGLDLYADILKKEDSIIDAHNVANFKKSMESIKNIRSFPVSLYAKCGEVGGEFLYRPRAEDAEKFAEFNLEECVANKEKFKNEILPEIQEYMDGKKEATALNPSNGRLREIYVFARQNEHCFTEMDTVFPNGDSLLHLRFMKDFNVNFANYYKDDFARLNDVVQKLMTNPAAFIDERKKKLDVALESVDKISQSDAAYEAAFGPIKKALQKQIELNEIDPFYGRCLGPANSSSMSTGTASTESPSGSGLGLGLGTGLGGGLGTWPSSSSGGFGLVLGNCDNLRDEINAHNHLKRKLNTLENKDSFLFKLKLKIESKKSEDIEAISKMSELKAMSMTLEKMQKAPNTLTRKELILLKDNLAKVSETSSLGNFTKLDKYLELYKTIDSEAYPFSWHEPAGKDGIETPNKTAAFAGNSFTSMRIPLELNVIEDEIEHMRHLTDF